MNDMDPKLSYTLQYNRHGVRMAMPPAFVTPGIANSAGVKNRVGNAAQQATQNPISPSGNVQSSNSVGYDIGTGWYIGFDKGIPKLFIGNSAGNKLTWDGTRLTINGDLIIGQLSITANPGDDLQVDVDFLSDNGGGILYLTSGTFTQTSTLTVPSNVQIIGIGAGGSIIDFGNGAFQIRMVGTNAYTTGTVAATNKNTALVGTGTTWTAAMIGRFILLGDYWYEITARTDNTHITIGSPYIGATATGLSYVIADTVGAIALKAFTVQNSSIELIKAQYCSGLTLDAVTMYGGLKGIDVDDSANVFILNSVADTCGTGIDFSNVPFGELINNGISNCTGDGFVANNTRNTAIIGLSSESNGGRGIVFTNTSNTGCEDFSVQNNTGIGMEYVSGNSGISIVDGQSSGNGSDGIKFTATSDACTTSQINIMNNGGYGANVAASSCDNNIFLGNYFATNSTANFNNSGTGTLIRSNIGVADN